MIELFDIKGIFIVLKESSENIRKIPGHQTYDPPVDGGAVFADLASALRDEPLELLGGPLEFREFPVEVRGALGWFRA
jgi:hypothetical protein